MIGFGFWDGSNYEFDSVDDNVLNLLDFPMESLESDGFGEDLDAKFRKLGPIPCEALRLLSSSSSSSSVLIRNLLRPLPSEEICQLNTIPDFDEYMSGFEDSGDSSSSREQISSSVLSISSGDSSGSSFSGEKNLHSSLIPLNDWNPRKRKRSISKISHLSSVIEQRSSNHPVFSRI